MGIALAVAWVCEREAEARAEAGSVHTAVVTQRLGRRRAAVPCGQRNAEGVAKEADDLLVRRRLGVAHHEGFALRPRLEDGEERDGEIVHMDARDRVAAGTGQANLAARETQVEAAPRSVDARGAKHGRTCALPRCFGVESPSGAWGGPIGRGCLVDATARGSIHGGRGNIHDGGGAERDKRGGKRRIIDAVRRHGHKDVSVFVDVPLERACVERMREHGRRAERAEQTGPVLASRRCGNWDSAGESVSCHGRASKASA